MNKETKSKCCVECMKFPGDYEGQCDNEMSCVCHNPIQPFIPQEELNQCVGCQAGLPVLEGVHYPKEATFGYRGATMYCSKDRYTPVTPIEEEIPPEEFKCGGCRTCEACLHYSVSHPIEPSWEEQYEKTFLIFLGEKVIEKGDVYVQENIRKVYLDCAKKAHTKLVKAAEEKARKTALEDIKQQELNRCTPGTCPYAEGAVWGINSIALEDYKKNHDKNHK